MEPNDLKSPTPPDDAQLEVWLRANSALPPLPDAGFTPRVLAELPPPRRRFSPRFLACLAGALLGGLLAMGTAFSSGNPLDRLPALDAALAESLSQLASPATGLAVLATVGSMLFVFWRDLRRFVQL